jgi:glutathione peroxidase
MKLTSKSRPVILILVVMTLLSAKIIDRSVQHSIYEVQINSLDNAPVDFQQFAGKKILIVNVASKCGYTKQYASLQKLHETHGDKVTIIGVPCNQFGKQEPGTSAEIATFCQENYGVSFLMTEKVEVKGDGQHPLYQWLTKMTHNGVKDSKVKWNFQKYLIDEQGNLMEVFSSGTDPSSKDITSLL